ARGGPFVAASWEGRERGVEVPEAGVRKEGARRDPLDRACWEANWIAALMKTRLAAGRSRGVPPSRAHAGKQSRGGLPSTASFTTHARTLVAFSDAWAAVSVKGRPWAGGKCGACLSGASSRGRGFLHRR